VIGNSGDLDNFPFDRWPRSKDGNIQIAIIIEKSKPSSFGTNDLINVRPPRGSLTKFLSKY